ncbi:MAG: hypothetical protein A2283_06320 [Lentisphaerae bacterium RIFOXYA12_FULL_48_11]|nr:MAG: hypothetical protein A2283_06320 [Lentisphaerae bacterium RIFOXYA12_FULL_48_11]
MTKQQYIQRGIDRVLRLASLISIPVVAVTIFMQLSCQNTPAFWIVMYTVLGICSLAVLAWLIAHLKCPDCGHNLWFEYLRSPLDDKSMTAMIKNCPRCHTDFESEMEATTELQQSSSGDSSTRGGSRTPEK